MFASVVEVAKAITAPALSEALYELAAHAQAAAVVLEQWAGQLARVARDTAAPVPPRDEVILLDQVIGLSDLLRIAQDEGRAVYAP